MEIDWDKQFGVKIYLREYHFHPQNCNINKIIIYIRTNDDVWVANMETALEEVNERTVFMSAVGGKLFKSVRGFQVRSFIPPSIVERLKGWWNINRNRLQTDGNKNKREVRK